LLFAIADNHPFEQGNKRTGFLAFRSFLLLNGYDIVMGDEVLGPMITDVITGISAQDEFIAIVQDFIVVL
jgi:death on curing protein